MVTEVLDRQLVRLRTRLAKTPLPGFFRWWGQQLLACLPPRWQTVLAQRADALLIETRDGQAIVWRDSARGRVKFGRIALDQPADAQAAEFQRMRARIADEDVRVVRMLPAERVLRRTLTLPAAAEENLRQVLAFEMDRQTPFKADQVYFDSRVAGRDADGRNIQVELVVIPRAQMDAELAAVAGGTIALDGVDCWLAEPGGARRELNLLPTDRRARRRNLRLPLNLGLLALALVLIVVNMGESLSNRAAAIEAMRAEVEKANADARQVAALKKSLQDSIGGANFLTDKKRQGPLVVAMLDDLTKRMPDDTFLERLNVENGQVQLQGQSKEAAKLIALLQPSPYLANAAFQGQIQPDPRTGKERFQINADVKRPGDKAADKAGAEKAGDAKHMPASKRDKDKEAADGATP